MPANASSGNFFIGYLVGTSGTYGVPGLISHIAASSAALAAGDITAINAQLASIAS